MSRELKFRIWFKPLNIFEYVTFNEHVINPSEKYKEFKDIVEYQQFIGNTDKNDKEIYEGDFVTYETRRGSVKAQVFWSNEMSCWMLIDEDQHLDCVFEIGADILTVVGNIFEK